LVSKREYAFLGPLIEFLAFLVQKLCQKYSKYGRKLRGDLQGLVAIFQINVLPFLP